MLEFAVCSGTDPEGGVSIFGRTAERASLAAEARTTTADKVKALGLIDEVIPEPLGGAHRDYDTMAHNLKETILREIAEIKESGMDKLLENRFNRLMSYGYC